MNITKYIAALLVLMVFAIGCATPQKFAPPAYISAQYDLPPLTLTSSKKVYICPVIDGLADYNRGFINPQFSASAYLTDALKQELSAAGLMLVTTTFETGTNFETARQVIIAQANQQENAVYVISEVKWLSAVQATLDARILSSSGAVLFEKRGLCIKLQVPTTAALVTKMAIWQIIADPNFQKALL